MNGYELSKVWFDWCFDNPEKISPNHTALYFFALEHCNRLGWKDKFGFPTEMAKDAIGIKSYKTYIKTLNDLVDWGFVTMIERSKNQYSANIIALVKNTKAPTKARTKAMLKHVSKQGESTYQSTHQSNASIIKPDNHKPNNLKPDNVSIPNFSDFLNYSKTLKPYKVELDFAIEAKYNAWVENGWKDGNGNKIKNWKTKIQNTITFLKPIYGEKSNSGHSNIDESTATILNELLGNKQD